MVLAWTGKETDMLQRGLATVNETGKEISGGRGAHACGAPLLLLFSFFFISLFSCLASPLFIFTCRFDHFLFFILYVSSVLALWSVGGNSFLLTAPFFTQFFFSFLQVQH